MTRKVRQLAAANDVQLIVCGSVRDTRDYVRLRFIPARLDLDPVSTVILSGDLLEVPLSLTGMDKLITLAALASAYCDGIRSVGIGLMRCVHYRKVLNLLSGRGRASVSHGGGDGAFVLRGHSYQHSP